MNIKQTLEDQITIELFVLAKSEEAAQTKVSSPIGTGNK